MFATLFSDCATRYEQFIHRYPLIYKDYGGCSLHSYARIVKRSSGPAICWYPRQEHHLMSDLYSTLTRTILWISSTRGPICRVAQCVHASDLTAPIFIILPMGTNVNSAKYGPNGRSVKSCPWGKLRKYGLLHHSHGFWNPVWKAEKHRLGQNPPQLAFSLFICNTLTWSGLCIWIIALPR